MASSGLKIGKDIMDIYEKLRQTGKKPDKPRVLILKIEDKRKIVIEKQFTGDEYSIEKHDEVIDSIPADDARFVVLDFPMKNEFGYEITEIVLILWAPQSGPKTIFKIMPYTTSFESVKSALEPRKTIQADNFSQLSYEAIVEKVNDKKIK